MEEKTDLALGDDTLAFLENGGGEKHLLPDHSIVLVVRVIGVTELTVRSKLELKELVSELPFVADIVPQVKLVLFFRGHESLSSSLSLDFPLLLPFYKPKQNKKITLMGLSNISPYTRPIFIFSLSVFTRLAA